MHKMVLVIGNVAKQMNALQVDGWCEWSITSTTSGPCHALSWSPDAGFP
jgi:hypothetical protein